LEPILRREVFPPVGDRAPGLGPPGKAMTEEIMVQDPGPRGEGHSP
jgi:intein-encoded DNA endonuclease-like protein